MKKLIAALAVSLLQTTSAGEPAFFRDSLLSIREGIIVLGEQIHYYRNLQMQLLDNGDFRVLEGENLALAQVDELAVAVLFTDPPQVELQVLGHMSTPCNDLKTAVSREGNTFYVAIAESPHQTFQICVQVLEPYEQTIPLDVTNLGPGDYLVKVNEEFIDFTLE